MCQPGDVLSGPLACPQAHVQGVQGEVGAQAGGHLPADHHAGEDVQDERGVDPARVRADVRQIGHPQLVRCCGDELPLDQIGGSWCLSALAVGGLAGLPPPDPGQSFGLHQPLDGATGHLDVLAVELGPDLPGAVDTDVVGVDLADRRH